MSPEDVVRAMLDAWGRLDVEEIISHFAPDAVYENVPIGTATGLEEVRTTVEQFVKDMNMTFFEAEMLQLAVAGNVVLTERVDHIVMGGTKMDLRLMGVFEIDGDKVKAWIWRDYFDGAGLASGLGALDRQIVVYAALVVMARSSKRVCMSMRRVS